MAASSLIRREVYYSGHVQGVGFRYTAQRVARGFQVAGYVQNLPDRRVKLVVEGARAEVQSFLAEVAEAMAGHIRQAVVQEAEATGRLDGFDVLH